MNPIEPPPTPWELPSREQLAALESDDDLVAVGADLEPGHAAGGLPPRAVPDAGAGAGSDCAPARPRRRSAGGVPPLRGVLRLDGLRVSRSLRRSVRDFEIRVDTAFDEVVAACGDPRRPGGVDRRHGIREAYGELHRLGWAHSVEAWQDGRLAGGLYGVAIGGLFAGESMFHRRRDASKVALVALVDRLSDAHGADRLIDVQWSTPHLASLGVEEIDRRDVPRAPARRYSRHPLPDVFAQRDVGGGALPASGGPQ